MRIVVGRMLRKEVKQLQKSETSLSESLSLRSLQGFTWGKMLNDLKQHVPSLIVTLSEGLGETNKSCNDILMSG